MKNTSYEFKVPAEIYDDFKTDIEGIAGAIEFDRAITFDDEAKTVFFNCDSRAIFFLFEENLSEEKKEKYDFICCAAKDYKDCTRFEDESLVTFQEAYNATMKRYEQLEKELEKKPFAREVSEDDIDTAKSLVISEYHPDPLPKEKLMELLPNLDPNTTLVLEKLPASQNDAVRNWLKDGNNENDLPPSLKVYCDLVDQNHLEEAPPSATHDYRTRISTAIKDILFTAKKSNVDVMFLENEHSDLDNRHEHLVVALSDLKEENPSKKFVLLCGLNHENRSMNKITLSDVIGAQSCRILDKKLIGPEFYRIGKECEAKDKPELAQRFFNYAAEAGYNFEEKESDQEETWVKTLNLKDEAEKPRSFAEAAQAGKMKSTSGAHEL